MWVLPIFCWFFSALLFARRDFEWRAAFLSAAVLWGGLVTAFTEFLSCFNLLTMRGLAFCWGITTAILLLLNFNLKRPWKVWGKYPLSSVETWLACGVALVCLATLITAILSPPNTWDSMTYHMSRVMHWLQNRSVDHYPTHILRQIEMNPWAEFAITQFQALSGGDRYANLVQWFSMVGSLVGASLIAERLGGNRSAQFFAAVIAATIPMGILQSSGAKNDYAVAFWLLCSAWAGLQLMKSKELKWAAVFGASLGLAVLTKGTAYLYALPFAAWVAFSVLRSAPRQAVAALFFILVPLILLNANHYQRNLRVFSNPLSSGEERFFNEEISAGVLVSNLLRNAALQLTTPLEGLNQFFGDGVVRLHERLNLDIDDPETTWQGTKFQDDKVYKEEDSTGNFLHVVLAGAVLLTLVCSRACRKTGTSVPGYVSAAPRTLSWSNGGRAGGVSSGRRSCWVVSMCSTVT
jgi:hypothetical protein